MEDKTAVIMDMNIPVTPNAVSTKSDLLIPDIAMKEAKKPAR